MLNAVIGKEFRELGERVRAILTMHGHSENTNPYGVNEVDQLLAEQRSLFSNDSDKISRCTAQVLKLLTESSLWELPRVSRDINMLATSSGVIGSILKAGDISILSQTDIDRAIEADFARLNQVIGINGSSFQMDRISPILFNLCENFGRRAMSHVAREVGLDSLKEQLRLHKLAGPLGAFSAVYVGQGTSSLEGDLHFADSLRNVLAFYQPYKSFYSVAQRGNAMEASR